MRVSVIVPVRNESACLRGTLLGLGCQDFPVDDYEILVIDGESDDGTADDRPRLPDVNPQPAPVREPKAAGQRRAERRRRAMPAASSS